MKRRLILIITLIFFIFYQHLFSQSYNSLIDGYVFDNNHVPLKEALVCIWDAENSEKLDCIYTDRNGYYQFDNLEFGTYALSASKANFYTLWYDNKTDPLKSSLLQINSYNLLYENINFYLNPVINYNLLIGKVYDYVTNKPIKQVSIISNNTTVYSNDEGEFSIKLNRGENNLKLLKEGYKIKEDIINFSSVGDKLEKDYFLIPNAKIKGCVYGYNNEPLDNISIKFGNYIEVFTNSDGCYETNILPDSYLVYINKEANNCYDSLTDNISIKDNENKDFILSPKGEISGEVISKDNISLDNFTVYLFDADNFKVLDQKNSKIFTFKVPCGSYSLLLEANNKTQWLKDIDNNIKQIYIKSDSLKSSNNNFNIIKDEKVGNIRGKIKNIPEDVKITKVFAYSDLSDGYSEVSLFDNNSFEFDKLPVGEDYIIGLYSSENNMIIYYKADNTYTLDYNQSEFISVNDNKTTYIEFDLSGLALVPFKIFIKNLSVLKKYSISLYNNFDSYLMKFISDNKSEYKDFKIRQGAYFLKIKSSDGTYYYKDNLTLVDSEDNASMIDTSNTQAVTINIPQSIKKLLSLKIINCPYDTTNFSLIFFGLKYKSLDVKNFNDNLKGNIFDYKINLLKNIYKIGIKIDSNIIYWNKDNNYSLSFQNASLINLDNDQNIVIDLKNINYKDVNIIANGLEPNELTSFIVYNRNFLKLYQKRANNEGKIDFKISIPNGIYNIICFPIQQRKKEKDNIDISLLNSIEFIFNKLNTGNIIFNYDISLSKKMYYYIRTNIYNDNFSFSYPIYNTKELVDNISLQKVYQKIPFGDYKVKVFLYSINSNIDFSFIKEFSYILSIPDNTTLTIKKSLQSINKYTFTIKPETFQNKNVKWVDIVILKDGIYYTGSSRYFNNKEINHTFYIDTSEDLGNYQYDLIYWDKNNSPHLCIEHQNLDNDNIIITKCN